jgi:hypothetical protein
MIIITHVGDDRGGPLAYLWLPAWHAAAGKKHRPGTKADPDVPACAASVLVARSVQRVSSPIMVMAAVLRAMRHARAAIMPAPPDQRRVRTTPRLEYPAGWDRVGVRIRIRV